MSAEIVLSPANVTAIREGATVAVDSSDGKIVNLSTMIGPDDGRFRVVVSYADLDVIEQKPEGLVVADASGSPEWNVRVVS